MFQKFAVLIAVLVVAIAASGCAGAGGGPFSSLHYGGEGMLGGAAAGGITAAAITNGHPLWTAVGAVSGAIVGGVVGGQVSKGPGIQERDMGLAAKQFALQQECRRDEWNRTEQAVRWAQAYGGKPEQYYVPDHSRCDRSYAPVPVQVQPQNYYGQPYYGQPTYTPQFNMQYRRY